MTYSAGTTASTQGTTTYVDTPYVFSFLISFDFCGQLALDARQSRQEYVMATDCSFSWSYGGRDFNCGMSDFAYMAFSFDRKNSPTTVNPTGFEFQVLQSDNSV